MSEAAAAFDALAEEFFSVWFRYHPDVAVESDIRGFERLLPAQSDDELAALGSWLETLVVALEELDYAALDVSRQIDLRLMFGAARVEHQELLERDWRHRDPLRYLPVGEIYRLTLQPSADVRDALAALLGAVPEYLRLALSRLRPMAELVAPELAAAAVDETERGRCYLRELARSPWLRRHCHGWCELETQIDEACTALAAYGEALRGEIGARAGGRLGCGEAHLRLLFRHRHFMEFDSERAHGVLLEALDQVDKDLTEHCAELGLSPDRIWQHLEARSVEGVARLEACRRESEGLAAFFRGQGLVSLPAVPLRLCERPACPRPLRCDADYIPDRGGRVGTFFLSAAAEGAGRGEPLAVLRGRCLDRTWGGAHLLAFSAGDEGWRLPRRLCAGASLVGAWGLYLRQQLVEVGYLAPEDRLYALLQRRRSIRLALLDLDLHLGRVEGAEALSRLDGIQATDQSDLVRLARQPGDALAGVLGWRALGQVRELLARREGDLFSERAFHDRLLSRGPIPLSLILEQEVGHEQWREAATPLGI
ncbi:MAG: DUF885 family protein [Pseudomonadota bacterium]|nr:DUF885 family protein [Pseudomonadota bacterium]